MPGRRFRWHLAISLFLLIASGSPAGAAPAYLMRISTENTRNHVQTQAIALFAKRLQAAAKGRLTVEFSYGARLFRDRDVVAALSTGKVEMGVPGMWQLDRFSPDVGIYMLPIFYGRSSEVQHRVRDGKLGAEVSRKIESDLEAIVPGRWLDLGFAQLYFTDQPVKRYEDLQGREIRIPGGTLNQSRLQSFGAQPTIIAWPDLPYALDQGAVTGILTTDETVHSAKLWRDGIRYAFADREYFAQYVPLISGRFWHQLPADLQQLIRTTWNSIVDDERRAAALAQQQAREKLKQHGIEYIQPPEAEIARWRKRALDNQGQLIKQLGIDPQVVSLAERSLEPR